MDSFFREIEKQPPISLNVLSKPAPIYCATRREMREAMDTLFKELATLYAETHGTIKDAEVDALLKAVFEELAPIYERAEKDPNGSLLDREIRARKEERAQISGSKIWADAEIKIWEQFRESVLREKKKDKPVPLAPPPAPRHSEDRFDLDVRHYCNGKENITLEELLERQLARPPQIERIGAFIASGREPLKNDACFERMRSTYNHAKHYGNRYILSNFQSEKQEEEKAQKIPQGKRRARNEAMILGNLMKRYKKELDKDAAKFKETARTLGDKYAPSQNKSFFSQSVDDDK